MSKRILFVFAVILLVLSGAYLCNVLRNSPIFNKEIQCEVAGWEKGDLDIGIFLAKMCMSKTSKVMKVPWST